MNTPENGYWITESTTYKIFANSEEEARLIWNRYWCDGEPLSSLNVKIKDGNIEADWQWTREEGDDNEQQNVL
jgi:hypothetical protein